MKVIACLLLWASWPATVPLDARRPLAMVRSAEPSTRSMSPNELISKSDDLRRKGDLAGSARALDAAYRGMTMEQRVGDLGRFVIVQASADYENARASSPDDAKLQEEHLALVSDYIADLDAARASGIDAAEADEEEEMLRALVPAPSDSPTTGDDGYLRAEDYEMPSRDTPTSDESLADSQPTERRQRRSSPKPERRPAKDHHVRKPIDPLTGALIGGGTVAFLGGAALLSLGATFPARVTAARQDAIEHYEFTEDEALPGNWRKHEEKERREGWALVGTGAVIAAAGVTAVVWGGVRSRRHRSAQTVLVPNLSRGGLAVALRYRF